MSYVDWVVHKKVKKRMKKLIDFYNRGDLLKFLEGIEKKRVKHEAEIEEKVKALPLRH